MYVCLDVLEEGRYLVWGFYAILVMLQSMVEELELSNAALHITQDVNSKEK